jgi:Family of unknown function (DUF5906)/Bifunctional DNA primase/polymerase, N-terminal
MAPDDLHHLLEDGFAIVPVLKGEKRPEHKQWQKRTFTLTDFGPQHDVGVKCGEPSGHKVDVDLDAPEAVAVADWLPVTRSHGRPGKRHSHHWFICPETATVQFKDPIGGQMLVELRSTGGQTVVPPSRHPSGEALAWENQAPYVQITAAALKHTVAEIATMALFARHWPAGSRHIAALHVGGCLARLGLPPDTIERLVGRVAEIAGDDDVRDRTRAARESAEKVIAGIPATGGPHFDEVFTQGAVLVKAITSWFGRPTLTHDQIERMNETHFVVQLGGTMMVAMEEPDRVTFQSFFSFRERYCNQFVGKQSLGDAWLKSPKRRQYEHAVFAPPDARWPAGPRDYNLWRGFAVVPDTAPHPERRCARYLDHAYHVIAADNLEHGDYVLDLLADTVQHPGRLIGKTLCMRGPQGVGKSVFIEPFGWLFGQRHFIIVNSRDQLVGQFNGHLSSRVVIFADEAVWGGHKQDEGTLKRLISQDTVTIRRLYTDAVMELNCAHLFMATNEHWPFPAGNLERRLVCLDVAGHQAEPYYRDLWTEIRTPGFGPALLATLLARPVDEARLRRGLDTKALAEVKTLSAHPIQQWWQQLLEDGALIPDDPWPTFLATRPLYEQYCEDMGHRRAGAMLGTRKAFATQLRPLLPGEPTSEKQRAKVNTAKYGAPVYRMQLERGYALAPLAACRAHFDRVSGSVHDWPPEDD